MVMLAGEMPVEGMPVEGMLAGQMLVEQMLVEQMPAEEMPVEETPAGYNYALPMSVELTHALLTYLPLKKKK